MYPKSTASWLNYFSQCTHFHKMCGKKQSMPPVIMTSPKDDGQAHQISVTRPVFEYLGKPLRTTISFPLSTRLLAVGVDPHGVKSRGYFSRFEGPQYYMGGAPACRQVYRPMKDLLYAILVLRGGAFQIILRMGVFIIRDTSSEYSCNQGGAGSHVRVSLMNDWRCSLNV